MCYFLLPDAGYESLPPKSSLLVLVGYDNPLGICVAIYVLVSVGYNIVKVALLLWESLQFVFFDCEVSIEHSQNQKTEFPEGAANKNGYRSSTKDKKRDENEQNCKRTS